MTAHLDQLAALAASLPPGAVLAHVVTEEIGGRGQNVWWSRAWAKIGDEPWRQAREVTMQLTHDPVWVEETVERTPDPEARWRDAQGHQHHNRVDESPTWDWYHEPDWVGADGEEYPGRSWAFCFTCGEEIDVPMVTKVTPAHYVAGMRSGTLTIEQVVNGDIWRADYVIVGSRVEWVTKYGLAGRHVVQGVIGPVTWWSTT